MLYIFLVDTGSMLTLDMDLALDTVAQMKNALSRNCRIPTEKQVLLISGGESLEDEERVCKYNAGTDTNPIFLFSLANIESKEPPVVSNSGYDENDENLESRAENSLTLPDSQSTVAVRSSIAQEYVRASANQIRACETLIHDQHLQHQGWQAVVANLDDTGMALKKRRKNLEGLFKNYLSNREDYRVMVDNFDDDVAVLHRIPVFPSLLEVEKSESMIGSVIHSPQPFRGESLSLLEWINSRGSSQSLEQLADSCYRSIEKLDGELLDNLNTQVNSAIETSQLTKMKEIRGLSERLQGLEQILIEAQRRLQEQQDLAQAFAQNLQRASGLRDLSILPDLCASHKQQMKVMSQNFQQIVSIRRRTQKAKEELSASLHHRMKWIVAVQDKIAEQARLIVMHSEELKRLVRKMEVIEQLHAAPSVYIASAVEVVRRKAFSDRYLERAGALSSKFSVLYENEMELRKNFQGKLRKHFLSKMFPGMDDRPPSFATQKPAKFDANLPGITLSDVEKLRMEFPDLAKSLQVPNEDAFANLLAKSMTQSLTQEDDETLSNLQTMPKKLNLNSNVDIGSISVIHKFASDNGGGGGYRTKKTPRSKSVLNDDSETDTDEFERKTRFFNNATKRKSNGDNKGKTVLTQSLPLTESSLALPPLVRSAESFEFTVDKSVDPSCSSADPSSSSAGNTSVAPSSSSDGSVLEHEGSTLSGLNISKGHTDNIMTCSRSKLSDLKQNLNELKDKVLSEKSSFDANIAQFQTALASLSGQVEQGRLMELENAVKKTAVDITSKTEEELDKLRQQLNIECNKLEDCNREIEMYRQQLEQLASEADVLKTELIDVKAGLEARHTAELEEQAKEHKQQLQKILLDHEFDLENLKMSMNRSEQVHGMEDEIRKLKNEIVEQQDMVSALRAKTRLLENAQEEKFHSEKDKIVQILEAGFSQRERLALEKHEQELNRNYEKKLEDLHKNHKETLDKLKMETEEFQRLNDTLESEKVQREQDLQEIQTKLENEFQEKISRQRKIWEEEHDREMKHQADKLSRKAKNEVETLRARFRIMQTTGALERSPSASESELSLESPRSDIFENIRSSLAIEHDNNLRAERLKWEKRIEELKDEHRKALENTLAKEKRKVTAEKQVQFNEALKRANAEKEREVLELKAAVAEFEKKIEDKDLVKKNIDLEKEVSELKAAMNTAMMASVMPISANSSYSNLTDVESLQRENKELKTQLSNQSTHNVVDNNSRISVKSVNKGELVMIIWREENQNFGIYSDVNLLHFLHSECLSTLGLRVVDGVPNKRYVTGEVVDKEYCQAKKPENRFRVPQGTKFYRVKCKPIS